MLAVRGFSVSLRRFEKLFLIDPAVFICNLLDSRYLDALALFDHLDKGGCFDEAVHRAGIKPRKAAAEQLDIKLALVKIELVEACYLKLASGTGLYLLCKLCRAVIVEIKSGYAVIGFGIFRLFLNRENLAVRVKFDYAEAFGVI